MHTQHVKFSRYVAWAGGMGGVVAVGVVFEEGEVSGMEEADDDVDGSVLEAVVVVVVVVVGLLLAVAWVGACPTLESREKAERNRGISAH